MIQNSKIINSQYSKTKKQLQKSLKAKSKTKPSKPEDRKYYRADALVTLGRRIRHYRLKTTGLSQEDFAMKLSSLHKSHGLHRTYLSAIERGEYNITVMTLIIICSGLGMDLDELVQGLEDYAFPKAQKNDSKTSELKLVF